MACSVICIKRHKNQRIVRDSERLRDLGFVKAEAAVKTHYSVTQNRKLNEYCSQQFSTLLDHAKGVETQWQKHSEDVAYDVYTYRNMLNLVRKLSIHRVFLAFSISTKNFLVLCAPLKLALVLIRRINSIHRQI